MNEGESLIPFSINAGIAILILLVSVQLPYISKYGYLLSAVFAVVSIVQLGKYILIISIDGFSLMKNSNSITPASEFAHSLNGLPVEALSLVRGFTIPHIRVYPGGKGQQPDYLIGNTSVTYEFAQEMLNNSDSGQLWPIRSYSDGSAKRRMAQEFTEYLQILGWVTTAAGNQSAKWVNGWSPWMAKVSFGMETNEFWEEEEKKKNAK